MRARPCRLVLIAPDHPFPVPLIHHFHMSRSDPLFGTAVFFEGSQRIVRRFLVNIAGIDYRRDPVWAECVGRTWPRRLIVTRHPFSTLCDSNDMGKVRFVLFFGGAKGKHGPHIFLYLLAIPDGKSIRLIPIASTSAFHLSITLYDIHCPH
jgi:hypothetical protein